MLTKAGIFDTMTPSLVPNNLTLNFWEVYEKDFPEESNMKAPRGSNSPFGALLSCLFYSIQLFNSTKSSTLKGEKIMVDMKVGTYDKKGRQDKFLQRDLPVAYLLVRLTMGIHMIAHGGVRLPILGQFAADTRKAFAGVNLLGLPFFPDWLVNIICYAIPPVEFVIGILLTVGFKTRLASIVGNIVMLILMFGTVAQKNFSVAHLMWFYVLIFAALGALNFADRYSLDAMKKYPPKD